MRHLSWPLFLAALIMFIDAGLMMFGGGGSLFMGYTTPEYLEHRLLLAFIFGALWVACFFARPRRWFFGGIRSFFRGTVGIFITPRSLMVRIPFDVRALSILLLIASLLFALSTAAELYQFTKEVLWAQSQYWGFVRFDDVDWIAVLLKATCAAVAWFAARGLSRLNKATWFALLCVALLTMAISLILSIYYGHGLAIAPPGVMQPIGMPYWLPWFVCFAGSMLLMLVSVCLALYLLLRRRVVTRPKQFKGFPIETPAMP